jgi:RNA-directed DNA polymerase
LGAQGRRCCAHCVGGLKEELDKLDVQMNQEKTKVVNLKEEGCFGFLGFDFLLNTNRNGKTYVSKTPKRLRNIITWLV